MWYIVFCSGCIIVIVIVLLLSKRQISKITKLKNLISADFEYMYKRNFVEENAIKQIINDAAIQLENLEKTNSLDYKNTLNLLKQDFNNIDVIINDEVIAIEEKVNLKEELEKLIKNISSEISKKKDIELIFKDIEEQYICDKNKLLSALRLIILKLIENNRKDIIKISVSNKNSVRSNAIIEIRIHNVVFGDTKEQMENICSLLNIEDISPEIIDSKIDPCFMIIRQNLLRIANDIHFENNKQCDMIINLSVKRVKKKKKKYKALIVDDNKPTAKMNQEVLNTINVDSDMVFSAEECIEAISKNYDDYDIIITDNQMPNMNGTELISELKNMPGFNLPVIIVTGDSNNNNIFIKRYGFDGYVQKPLSKEKIEELIKKLL